MPNILEQQDLLKGLPDDRLSMLMQNPTGDIPPFLVAAEAQRRQSIREQFSGGPQESVVDTLTKQLANVPQNIQAPAQQPPQMPQMQQPQMPQEMGGVAALQQGMRNGGVVQRYQSLGLVAPLQTRVQDVADQFGITVEQAAEMIKNNPSLSGTRPSVEYGTSFPITEENREARAVPSVPDLPVINMSPADYAIKQREAAREAKYQEMDSYPGYSGPSTYLTNSVSYDPLSSVKTKTASAANNPRDPNAGKGNTSLENQAKTDMTVDEYKAYLERIYGTSAEDSEYIKAKLKELYAADEPSSWEKSQKWFAAAQAAIQPGQSDVQAAINALSALGGGFADERAAERAGKRDLEEALIRQDIADRQAAREDRRDIEKGVMDFRIAEAERARASRATQDERRLEASKYSASEETRTAEMYLKAAERAEDDFRRAVESLTKDGVVSQEEAMKNPEIIRLQKRAQEYYRLHNDALAAAELGRKRYGDLSGVDFSFETATGEGPITRSRK